MQALPGLAPSPRSGLLPVQSGALAPGETGTVSTAGRRGEVGNYCGVGMSVGIGVGVGPEGTYWMALAGTQGL